MEYQAHSRWCLWRACGVAIHWNMFLFMNGARNANRQYYESEVCGLHMEACIVMLAIEVWSSLPPALKLYDIADVGISDPSEVAIWRWLISLSLLDVSYCSWEFEIYTFRLLWRYMACQWCSCVNPVNGMPVVVLGVHRRIFFIYRSNRASFDIEAWITPLAKTA